MTTNQARWQRWLPAGLLVVMCAIVGLNGVNTTASLSWPGDVDLFRDIAQAQTFADGDWQTDPQYLGESLWYNPLAPAIVAVTARATNQSVYVEYTRLGAYLNLLAPIGFFVLIAVLFDAWTALAATFFFLFVPSTIGEPSWAAATYSPWLFAANFAQAGFYFTLAAYVQLVKSEARRWWLITGLLLGVTFLAHTAPTFIAAGVIGLHTLLRVIALWWPRAPARDWLRPIAQFVAIGLIALAVGSPLLQSIVGRYGLRVLNTAPTSWVYDPLALRNWAQFWPDNYGGQPGLMLALLAGAGVILLTALRSGRLIKMVRIVFALWLSLTVVFLAYSYAQLSARQAGVILPSFVPSFHFLFYVRAAQHVLLGVLLASAVGWLAARVRRPWAKPVLMALTLATAFAWAWPTYLEGDDFVGQVKASRAYENTVDRVNAYHWVRNNTLPTTVFLASDRLATHVVGPAGRKIVSTDSAFSNPYVDWKSRATDRDAMFGQLMAGDCAAFKPVAAKYAVSYVIAGGNLAKGVDDGRPTCLETVYISPDVRVYRVLP